MSKLNEKKKKRKNKKFSKRNFIFIILYELYYIIWMEIEI